MNAFESVHLGELCNKVCFLGEMVEDDAFGVPHAKQVKGVPAFAVLEVEVGIDPFHEDFEQVG